MLATRILPPDEWDRLATLDNEVARSLPVLRPEDTTVFVVEDDGRVVGCCAVYALPSVWLEGGWVHPDYRDGRVLRRGLAAMRAHLRAQGVRHAMAGTRSPIIQRLLTGLFRGVALPGTQYVFRCEE